MLNSWQIFFQMCSSLCFTCSPCAFAFMPCTRALLGIPLRPWPFVPSSRFYCSHSLKAHEMSSFFFEICKPRCASEYSLHKKLCSAFFFVLHQWGYPRCTTRCCTELRTTLAILPERAEKHLLLPGLLPSCQTHLTIYKFTPTIAARCSTFLARCTAPAWVSSSWDRNPHSTPQLSIPALQAVYISTSLSPTNSVVEGSALI